MHHTKGRELLELIDTHDSSSKFEVETDWMLNALNFKENADELRKWDWDIGLDTILMNGDAGSGHHSALTILPIVSSSVSMFDLGFYMKTFIYT